MKNSIWIIALLICGVIWFVFQKRATQNNSNFQTQEQAIQSVETTPGEVTPEKSTGVPENIEPPPAVSQIIETNNTTISEPERPTFKMAEFVGMMGVLKNTLGEHNTNQSDTSAWEKQVSEKLSQTSPEQRTILSELGTSSNAEKLKLLFVAATQADTAQDPATLSYLKKTQTELAKTPHESFQLLSRAMQVLPEEYSIQKRALIFIAENLPGKKEEAKTLCKKYRSVASQCD